MKLCVTPSLELTVTFSLNKNNPFFTVKDSYLIVRRKDIELCLTKIREEPEYKFLQEKCGYKRTFISELREWEAHNMLYRMRILRSRTGDSDIDQKESWFRRLGYFFLSKIYELFIGGGKDGNDKEEI